MRDLECCPLCGCKDIYVGAFEVDCSNKSCNNHKKSSFKQTNSETIARFFCSSYQIEIDGMDVPHFNDRKEAVDWLKEQKIEKITYNTSNYGPEWAKAQDLIYPIHEFTLEELENFFRRIQSRGYD